MTLSARNCLYGCSPEMQTERNFFWCSVFRGGQAKATANHKAEEDSWQVHKHKWPSYWGWSCSSKVFSSPGTGLSAGCGHEQWYGNKLVFFVRPDDVAALFCPVCTEENSVRCNDSLTGLWRAEYKLKLKPKFVRCS